MKKNAGKLNFERQYYQTGALFFQFVFLFSPIGAEK